MRRVLTTVLLGCALVLTGWVVGSAASACSCAGGTTAEQFQRADVVFTGTLLSRQVQHPPGSGHDSDAPALHLFAVDTLHKGRAFAEQTVVSADSGASCGLELRGDGPFLVFATDPADGSAGQLAANLCGGTAPVTPELAAEVTQLTGGQVEAVPDPAAEAPVGVTDVPSGASALVFEVGAAVLALLAGVLAVLRRRRAERRATTVVVLTRD